MTVIDDIISDIQKLNSKANLSNLTTGVILLLILAGLSLWYFGKNKTAPTDSLVDQSKVLGEEGSSQGLGQDENLGVLGESEVESATGTGGPVVNVLPNTSSK